MSRLVISTQVAADMKEASWIRQMFEKGLKLKAELGDENVQDLSLGNPNAPPPEAFLQSLAAVAAERRPAGHRYMPNAGLPDARAAVARFLASEYRQPFDGAGVLLTSGAAGATNVVMRALLDPGDEVMVIAPYFPEYRFYIEQAQGRMVVVPSGPDFQPDLAALERAITPRTRAMIVNSPNNPTGAVYSAETCRALAALLERHDTPQRPLYLLCDDVYRRVLFGLDWCPTSVGRFHRAIVISSYSKDLSIPGERAGYVAMLPSMPERELLMAAMTMLNRTLGFLNLPALMQRVITRCADALCDRSIYQRNRDTLCDALRAYGYELTPPRGALYAFPRTPIDDDAAFVEILVKHRVLAVPGRGFGRPGHMRLSFCVDPATVERALPGLKAAIAEVRK